MSVPSFDDVPDDFNYGSSSGGAGGQQVRAISSDPYLHPWAVVFHLVFKIVAMVVYLLLTLLCSSCANMFIITFIVVILLCAADFWTVKNVTGRLLVGLRWWNMIEENGESKWHFESRADRTTIHRGESVVFWAALFIFTIAWFAFAFKNVFTLSWDWLVVDLVCLVLAGSNLGGYLKCANAARIVTRAASQYAMSYAVGEAQSRLTGTGGQSSNTSTSSNDFN